MRIILILLSLCITLFMQGCAVYDGVAYFHDSGELLDVKIDKHLRTKMAYVEARGEDGLFCSGSLRTVHGVSTLFRFWTCKGEDGKLVLACNDGRHLMGVWSSENCSTSQAVGGDQYGNTFVLAYGDTREEVLQRAGAGLGAAMPAFYDGPASPLYSSMLGYDGDSGMAVFAGPQTERAASKASRSFTGFFVSPDGRIATPAEGLRAGDTVSVYLPSEQSELPASIVSIDTEDDVAILKVEAEGSVGSAVRVIIKRERPKAKTDYYKEDYR